VVVQRVGIGARGWTGAFATPVVVSIGLAGGLRAGLSPGTVVVPAAVALEGGDPIVCDPAWVAALTAAAQRLCHDPAVGSLLTATHLVTGTERRHWASAGFDAVDMESAYLAGHGSRLAVVRVILDTPERELSAKWEHPWRALLDPRLAREAIWLLPHSRRFALRAAEVLAEALRGDVHAQV
jgi:nucleoside phosphorylase